MHISNNSEARRVLRGGAGAGGDSGSINVNGLNGGGEGRKFNALVGNLCASGRNGGAEPG